MGDTEKSGGGLSEVPGCRLLLAEPRTTITEAIQRMEESRIGAVVVVKENRFVGIFTAWDLLRFEARQPGRDLSRVPLSKVMTREVISGVPTDSVTEALAVMLKSGIGYLPLVEGDGPAGMLRLADILAHRCKIAEKKLSHLEGYLTDLLDAQTD